jgi:hypothetical protein
VRRLGSHRVPDREGNPDSDDIGLAAPPEGAKGPSTEFKTAFIPRRRAIYSRRSPRRP